MMQQSTGDVGSGFSAGDEQLTEKIYTDKIRAKVAADKEIIPEPHPLDGFYLFFSFDLVNSTQYKSVDKSGWPVVIRRFYELIEGSVHKWLSHVHLWKYVGDELLLYKRVNSIKDIHQCLSNVYTILEDSIRRLHSEFSGTKTILSIKATAWCAQVCYIVPQDLESVRQKAVDAVSQNMVLVQSAASGQESLDFLGPEIDLGFRISKYAMRQRLVVSAELAYLLYKERAHVSGLEKRLRIVSYETLKGIWDGRRYPIIWYEKEWTRIKESFLYDERFDFPLVANIYEGSSSIEGIDVLEKIYADLDLNEKAETLWKSLQTVKEPTEEESMLSQIPQGDLAEVHCVAVCFRHDGKILIAKRSGNKRRLPNCWEFGCGQLKMYESFDDVLKRSYKEDFGAELRMDVPPLPISSFEIYDQDERRKIPGIIFIAEVTNPETVKSIRHARIDWLDPSDLKGYKDEECVPDFKRTVHLALNAWNSIPKSSP